MASQLLFLPTQPAWLSWAMMVREIQAGKIYTPAFLLSPISGAPTFSVAKMSQYLPKVLPLAGSLHLDSGPSDILIDACMRSQLDGRCVIYSSCS